jgi:large subunit ribosomal protein L35
MPKRKTSRLAKKKFRVNAKGRLKRYQANTSHNTSKHGPKRRRRLRHPTGVDGTNHDQVIRMLPYAAS